VAATTLDGIVWLRVLSPSASTKTRRSAPPARVQPAPMPVPATVSSRPSDWLRQWLRRVAAVP
jgi:hypothetical protein